MGERTSVLAHTATCSAVGLRWEGMSDSTQEPPRHSDIHPGARQQIHLPRAERVPASVSDAQLVRSLRDGDEAAFTSLVTSYYPAMVRVALMYVPSRVIAEEVIQQTWLGVLRGIQRFEGRSSLKTWIFRILMNVAKTYGQREGRSVPFSALAETELDADEPAVDPDRFRPGDDPVAPGGWASAPQAWDELPERYLLSRETRDQIYAAMAGLPPAQREVILLRDVEGLTADEVCDLLGTSQGNQRVLLHRARSKVRRALERYLSEV